MLASLYIGSPCVQACSLRQTGRLAERLGGVPHFWVVAAPVAALRGSGRVLLCPPSVAGVCAPAMPFLLPYLSSFTLTGRPYTGRPDRWNSGLFRIRHFLCTESGESWVVVLALRCPTVIEGSLSALSLSLSLSLCNPTWVILCGAAASGRCSCRRLGAWGCPTRAQAGAPPT